MSLIKAFFNRKKQEKDINTQDMNAYSDLKEDLPKDWAVNKEDEANQSFDQDTSDEEMEYEIVEREIQPAKIICPDCGGITLEGLEFCDKCGGELL